GGWFRKSFDRAGVPWFNSPLMYKKGQMIETELFDTADKNRCVGKLEDGICVFVEGTAAVGDTVRAEIYKTKKRYLVASLKEILKFSDRRTAPRCKYFGLCGGCKWQHLDYSEQLRVKRKQVLDALEHLGGFEGPEVADCIPAEEIFGYRNKIDMDFTDRRYLTADEMNIPEAELSKPLDFALGFHAPGCPFKAIDIDHCDLASEEMNLAVETVRRFCRDRKLSIYSTFTHEGFLRNLVVRRGERTGELMVNLITLTHDPELMRELCTALQAALGARLTTFINATTDRKNMVAFGDQEYVLCGEGSISDRLGEYTYRISPNSFFQTNTVQAEKLYNEILKAARLTGSETVYDLFCGTGSIALFAAKHCGKVLGIELVEAAVADARKNAQEHGAANCSFRQMDLMHFGKIRAELEAFGLPDVVITDPPRAGMHPKAVEMLRELAPPVVIYVSCNPASLARDGQLLCEGGLYRLISTQPVDLFPQTNHVESVARFERVS
ncbi:MAG TPA: 23S rRNA (uracil(1939)-C(5))-methyltransferase RlmD, partial [Pontiellaceae bacterium]|nr:23S rRNA (uracil(1939)-C(5))-methyltransferase RlmD [Pontiellaceae bacterium]HPR83382.1 23S rRNA (uracil(1939)-C(5))-methyltransferase RlmD [Pontiellaceae bacterium]